MTYPERLRALDLPTLQYKRLRHNMVQVFKLLHGFDHVDEVQNICLDSLQQDSWTQLQVKEVS